MNDDFMMVELERGIKRLKNKAHLFHLFNSLYANAFVPDPWKIAIIIPLLKPGNSANEASSYRPISLTFCMGKPFERLVTNRLSWFVESRSIVGPEQAGFRTHHSTIDHVIKLDHKIKEGFINKSLQ